MSGNGPMEITGAESLLICTCMQSNHWPLCDGSHHTLGGEPELIRLDKSKTYYFCSCYRTKNRPFCDGSHAK
ncbi:MAG: CDGSH iron-sulfur domain-containing protein [Nitrospinae bacterium]|nr:CDGSH iron-sulfur domain-containing protein [Nitrospinota bacterium]